jgi:ABC-type sulfate transport system permease component
LVFAGATRQKTEVLPISIYLELSIGNVEGAVAVSLIMIAIALAVLVVVRALARGRADYSGAGRNKATPLGGQKSPWSVSRPRVL